MKGKDKAKVRLLILVLVIIVLLLLGIYFVFIRNNDNNNKNDNNSSEMADDTLVVSKTIDFAIDEMGFLLIIADIELSEELNLDKQIDMDVYAYDENDNLLHSYVASTRYYKIDGEKIIHIAFDDNESEDLENVEYLVTKISINDKTVEAGNEFEKDYGFAVNSNPEVVYHVSMYRVFMDLSDFYYDNSGAAAILYEDGSQKIERISYLEDTNYIGVSYFEDFSTNVEGSKLKSVSVYRIAYLREV